MKKETISADRANLRRLAEKALEDNTDHGDLSEKSPEDIASMVHELRVHQIELEMQNDELQRIQQELEQTKNQYSHLYDFSPVGYLSVSEKGFIEKANLTIASMLEVARGDLIGKPLSNFVHKDDQDILYHHRARLLETKAPQMCELRLSANDGPEFYARLECMIVKTKDDEIGEIRVAVSDITTIKQTEEELRESRQKYFSMLENIGIGVSLISPKMEVLELNRQMREWFPDVDAATKPICHTVYNDPPSDTVCDWCPTFKTLQDGKVHESITDTPAAGGIRHYRIVSSPIVDTNGEIMAAIEMVEDITERMQSEKSLRESEIRFSAIFQNNPAAIAMTRISDGRLVNVNKTWQNITGYTSAEAVGHTPFELNLWVNPKQRERIVEKSQNQGHARSEIQIRNKSGEIHYLLFSAESIEVSGQNYLLTMAQDITERKKTQKKLRLEKKRFQSYMKYMPGVAFIKDSQGRYMYLNETFEKSFKAKLEMWQGKTDLELKHFPDEVIEKLIQNDKQVLKTNRPLRIIEDVPFGDQMRNWLSIKFPISGKDENGTLIAGVAIDITDRIKSESALKESEKKFRAMMESFADPLNICSPDFTVDYMNPAMIRRVGRDATGEKCYSALHGLDSKCDWCVFDNVKFKKTIETSVKSPLDGRDYRVTNMPIHNNDGTISKMTIYRDITNYMNAVSQKERAQKQLAQAQKMESLGTLAGGIAHDFNNILSSIIGFTELSLDDVEKDSIIEDNLQEVFTAGKRAKDLVTQILTFARQSEKEMKPIQIDKIINEVLQFIRSSIPTTIEIIKSIDSDSLIIGNQTQVHQLLMNLCANAAQSMEDGGGTLEVTLKDFEIDKGFSKKLDLKPGNYIRITVSDTGVGIPSDIIDSIFEPYSTTKNPGEGTGMGLALVQGIVESYLGKIAVKSRPGEGSTFIIYLPVTHKRGIQPQYKPEQSPKGTERILFVDDEAPIAKMGKHGLERLGYQVTTKTSSFEALELFRSKPDEFDLIITDMTMPNMTGDKLAIELMKIRPDISVILCTGYSKKISEESANKIGIKAFTYKPIVKADLANTVRKVLDEAKSETQ